MKPDTLMVTNNSLCLLPAEMFYFTIRLAHSKLFTVSAPCK